MYLQSLTLLSLASVSLVHAGTAPWGKPCNLADLRLQQGTYQLWTECDSMTYCAANSTCAWRGCSRVPYPFGYPPDAEVDPPGMCREGQFCPDEEDRCLDLIPVDGDCQFQRDDQCQPPPNANELADKSGRGLNVNGAICLHNKCMWSNATLGSECTVENTPFIAYGTTGEFITIVSRGNCRPGLYCDASLKVCMNEKPIGQACTADKECSTWNCLSTGFCGKATNEPTRPAVWVYVLVAIGIFLAMFGTTFGLYLIHRKQRDAEREKRDQYWREQNAFHQTLQQMRETARASILSFSKNGQTSTRTTLYNDNGSDESHAPMIQQGAPKGSGLRHYNTSEDANSDYDEGLVMQADNKGRF